MRRELFLHLINVVCYFDSWFLQRHDALGRLGPFSLQKCTPTWHMLAYGVSAEACDEYCRLRKSTAMEAMKRWVVAIRGCFEAEYLRQPTRVDLERQVQINTDRGLLGMFASLDCMHWTWKNCPVAWQGQFQDKDKNRSVVLEVIADQSFGFGTLFLASQEALMASMFWIIPL
jgi:hypothetical protein